MSTPTLRQGLSAARPDPSALRARHPRSDPADPDTTDPHTGEQPDGTSVENPSGGHVARQPGHSLHRDKRSRPLLADTTDREAPSVPSRGLRGGPEGYDEF